MTELYWIFITFDTVPVFAPEMELLSHYFMSDNKMSFSVYVSVVYHRSCSYKYLHVWK